ncbi:orotidine-5'-phosphate decarboxylase [Virgibacillus sp. 179-BFC.A HS]|uniref:Orotidine 5'-phosphate decarboxylase n=1 Tax=Tigheibacillus jepli TaxID=3035914 RepID=A0ABU5CHW2_9BACI|nr:orotidine-5'-phosphate decarboxylase [Virgibacillus sp. 179-BFC.A HS]MDY0405943.1 orotidine-5'-phosphate decarboxylase [Virgibacillus sp. 179-BFC.A HS]
MKRGVFLALDFPDWKQATSFIQENGLEGVPVKVGMELFYREGPQVIQRLKQNGHPIFLDLKLHDIPTTVKKAMRNLAVLGVDMVTVHALGGSEMIKQAKQGLLEGGKTNATLIAVTVLTSTDTNVMHSELQIPGSVADEAIHLAKMAQNSGADGVVCAASEAAMIKNACTNDFLTVTPGIRLEHSHADDQKRVATPSEAIRNGADFLVIGRSVTLSENPKQAYEKVMEEIKK